MQWFKIKKSRILDFFFTAKEAKTTSVSREEVAAPLVRAVELSPCRSHADPQCVGARSVLEFHGETFTVKSALCEEVDSRSERKRLFIGEVTVLKIPTHTQTGRTRHSDCEF